jgi:hypothetical protein
VAWLLAREKQTPRSLLASRVLPLRRIERARYLKKTDRHQNECTSDAVLRTNKHWLAWHGRQRESAARKHCLLCLLFCASTVPVWTWLLCRAHVSSQCAVCFFERGLPRACHNTQAFARYKGQKHGIARHSYLKVSLQTNARGTSLRHGRDRDVGW